MHSELLQRSQLIQLLEMAVVTPQLFVGCLCSMIKGLGSLTSGRQETLQKTSRHLIESLMHHPRLSSYLDFHFFPLPARPPSPF